ncbi:MAG: hypothetical protein ACLFR0_03325 [Alphaproteobacteria bacterium]
MVNKTYFPMVKDNGVVPFASVEEAWFWFINAQKAKNEGARIKAGQSLYPRPCEPADIMNVITRLHRNRRLKMEHFHVLRHYGVRQYAPDSRRIKEGRACKLWREAMSIMEEPLLRKGIIEAPHSQTWMAAE